MAQRLALQVKVSPRSSSSSGSSSGRKADERVRGRLGMFICLGIDKIPSAARNMPTQTDTLQEQ